MTMPIIALNKVIVPFAGASMRSLGESNFFNPSNVTLVKNASSATSDKCVRALARVIYAMFVPMFCAAAGIIYHGCAALFLHLRGSKQMAADAHAFAAMVDALSLVIDIATLGVVPLIRGLTCLTSRGCAIATAPYFSSQKVFLPEGDIVEHRGYVYRELLKKV